MKNIIIGIVAIIICIGLIYGTIFYLGFKVIDYIGEQGLQSVIERIWEGNPQNK